MLWLQNIVPNRFIYIDPRPVVQSTLHFGDSAPSLTHSPFVPNVKTGVEFTNDNSALHPSPRMLHKQPST